MKPTLEINKINKEQNINEVLVDVEFGKYNPYQWKDQKKQKGPTCSFYTLRYVSFRYGKNFSDENEGRYFEKIFSEHRKNITKIGEKYATLNGLKDQQNRMEELIENCKTTLFKLNIDADDLISQFKKDYFARNRSVVPLDELHIFLFDFLLNQQIKLSDLEYSTWHPIDGIDTLCEQLRENGEMYVVVDPEFYNQEFKESSNQFGKRQVAEWKGSLKNNVPSSKHSILVVGVQKNGEEECVYFLDPNWPNNLNPPNYVFQIPYRQFVALLKDVNGNDLVNDKDQIAQKVGVHSGERVHQLRQFFANGDKGNGSFIPRAKL